MIFVLYIIYKISGFENGNSLCVLGSKSLLLQLNFEILNVTIA